MKLETEYKATIRSLERRIKQLEQELAKAHSKTVSVRNLWFETTEVLEKEHQKEMGKKIN